MSITFRAGRIPLDPNAPKPELTPHLCGNAFTAADSIDYYSKVTNWGELGNKFWGDCTCACDGHIAIQQTAYGLGKAQTVTDAETLQAYAAVSGFDINAGPPGKNPTDKGATVQAALEYLRKTGIGGFEIAAYGHIDPRSHDAVKHGVEDFGALSIGINFPKSGMRQFEAGQPLDAVPDDGGIEGGHCVMVAGFDSQFVYIVTWGQLARMTWAFWDKYVEEAWAVISRDWTTVTGLSLEAFGAEFASAFGGANPFAPSVIEELEDEIQKGVRGFFHKLGYRGVHV